MQSFRCVAATQAFDELSIQPEIDQRETFGKFDGFYGLWLVGIYILMDYGLPLELFDKIFRIESFNPLSFVLRFFCIMLPLLFV